MSNQKKELEKAIAQDVEPATQPDGNASGENNPESEGGGFSSRREENEVAVSNESSSGLTDKLFATEPNPSLEEVESLWKPDEGGIKRVQRGLNKMGGFDTTNPPAILDIVVGIVEEAKNRGVFDEVNPNEGESNESERF